MYAAATHELSVAMSLDFLGLVPPVFLGAAFIACLAAFTGAVVSIARGL
jgi:hypothetical protein